MANWSNPIIARAFTLLTYTSFGAAVWEFLLPLHFDWELVCRKRKLTLGTFLYLLCKYSMFFTAGIFLVASNGSKNSRCDVWIWIQYGAASFATNIATGLLYARVWALSGGHLVAVWGIGVLYAGLWGATIYSTYRADGRYIDELSMCSSENLQAHLVATVYQLVVDVLCLGAILFLLVRTHRKGSSSLWRFLMQQGVVYIVVICLVYIFDVVCTSLPLDTAIALTPSQMRLAVTFIAATRMQRGLIEFVEHRPVITSNVSGSSAGVFKRSRMSRAPHVEDSGVAVDLWDHEQSGIGLEKIASHKGALAV
ncbi:hypothetical protein BKA62DRAFT_458725 [Auriculariales sp. MPI-PUGE-AT-0066]|nr:hypothetical protein BKA62DRAFT_458725 [Auriculariales sp. MPI-PUGE-AT-0066]